MPGGVRLVRWIGGLVLVLPGTVAGPTMVWLPVSIREFITMMLVGPVAVVCSTACTDWAFSMLFWRALM